MQSVLEYIESARSQGRKLMAVLLDPDELDLPVDSSFIEQLNNSNAELIFIGGSDVPPNSTQNLVLALKDQIAKPLVIFPGSAEQITGLADALLFLVLISGRNPDYLIREQIKGAAVLKSVDLEVIPTSYILIENGIKSSVERVSGTVPLPRKAIELITNTAYAGELLGHKLIYLEAGSGAERPVPAEVIRSVRDQLKIPIIVGGGIRSKEQLELAFNSGADLVVIGTAFETDNRFFENL